MKPTTSEAKGEFTWVGGRPTLGYPRGRTLRLFHFSLVLLASSTVGPVSCSNTAGFAPWPELDADEIAFLLIEGDGDTSTRGPFFREVEGLAPERVASEGEVRLRWIALRTQSLATLSAAVDEERWVDLRIEPGAETCSEGRVLDGFERHPLEKAAPRTLRLDESTWLPADTAEGWAVLVPTLGERCFAQPAVPLRPYGDRPWLLEPEVVVTSSTVRSAPRLGWLDSAFTLDETHALSASPLGVFVFDRGQPWRNRALQVLTANSLARALNTSLGELVGIELEGVPATADRSLVVVHNLETEGTPGSAAWVTWNETNGFSLQRPLVTVTDTLHGVVRDADARWLAYGNGGIIVSGLFDGSEVETQRIPGAGDLRGFLFSSDAFEPHITFDANQRLFFGDAREQRWRVEASNTIVGGVGAGAVRSTGNGVEVYLAPLAPGITLRRHTRDQAPFTINVPRALDGCRLPDDGCGRAAPASRAAAMTLTPSGTMLFALEACGAVLEVELDRGCTRGLPFPDSTAEQRRRTQLTTARFEGTRLLVTGVDGLLLEAEWPE